MIVRDKSNVFKLLFAWKGTILPKVLPALSFVVLISACGLALLLSLDSNSYRTRDRIYHIWRDSFDLYGL